MNFPEALTLFRSPAATVRVEPPDVVIVEGAAMGPLGPLRFRGSHVRECRSMLVSYYREHHDRSYVAANDGESVIRLHVEGTPRDLLGPFAHAEGIAIAAAINLTRRELLFALPGFSVGVAADDASLVINTMDRGMRTTEQVPTADLVELALRDDDRLDVRCRIPTGLAPAGAPRWIELEFARDRPWLLGPLSGPHAAMLALAFRAWRSEHPRDREPTEVEERDLLADPARWHLRRIVATGRWHLRDERSSFANVWLVLPPDIEFLPYGTYRARVAGTWIYPDAAASRGYGHQNGWPGELQAETIDIVERLDQPRAPRDG